MQADRKVFSAAWHYDWRGKVKKQLSYEQGSTPPPRPETKSGIGAYKLTIYERSFRTHTRLH